jgi:hypothetical protein
VTGEREALIEAVTVERRRHEYQPVTEMCSCGWDTTPGQGTRGAWCEWELHANAAILTAFLSVRGTAPCPECEGTRWVNVEQEENGCFSGHPCSDCHGSGSVDTGPLLVLASEARCPHVVTSDEGTSYCDLAESALRPHPEGENE